MKKLVNQDPYKIGLVAVVVGVLFAGLITVISTVSFGTKNYTAHLAQTAGLLPGEDVQVAGVNVGQVKGLKLNGNDVLVSFNLKKSLVLGRQTTAEVKVATLLGTHYLAIDPQGTGTLPGNSIPLSQTSVPYNLQDVIDKGTAAIEKLDGPLLAKALTVVTDATEAGSDEFGPALQGIARVSEVIATRSSQVGDLLDAAHKVSDQLSQSSDNILGLMRQTTLVLDEIQTRRVAIHSLLVKATALSRALTTIVNTTQGDLSVALKNTRVVLGMLKSQDKTLRSALETLAPTARYFANALGNGPWADVNTPSVTPDAAICKGQGTC
jgi:phospholipid/cholesterol/gamma-HCH transport system substrate-binding protein